MLALVRGVGGIRARARWRKEIELKILSYVRVEMFEVRLSQMA